MTAQGGPSRMASPPTPQDARAIRRSLEAAQAEKLLRVVAMIDAIGERGAADALLTPLRPRLAMLRPARPLRFERLLFQPLDPVIVSGPRWQPDSPTIPRHALLLLANSVRAGLGERADEIDALIAGRTSRDSETAARAGVMLWPDAAEVLARAPAPAGWVEGGLRLALYAPMAHAISTAWRWHRRLQAMERDARSADQAAIATVVAGIAREPILTQAMMMALLLARLPHAASQLQSAIGAFGTGPEQAALRAAGSRAVEGLAAQLEGGVESQVAGLELAESGPEVRRLATLLDELSARADTAERRASIGAMRRRLDTSCRARFQAGLLEDLLAPLQRRTDAVDGATQTQFEQAARNLRGLETQARRIGGGEIYDEMLGAASKAMQAAATNGLLTRPRKVRLVEILSGADEALALLDGTPA